MFMKALDSLGKLTDPNFGNVRPDETVDLYFNLSKDGALDARGPWNREPDFKYDDKPSAPQGSLPQEVKNPATSARPRGRPGRSPNRPSPGAARSAWSFSTRRARTCFSTAPGLSCVFRGRLVLVLDPGGAARFRRAHLYRLGRLSRSRQFRHQHHRRRHPWLSALVGRAARQYDGNAVSGFCRQARHRLRTQPGADVPRTVAAAVDPPVLGNQRDRCDGHRPRRALGAAIGCSLLLGTSLFAGTVLAAALSWLVLSLHQRSFRAVEAIIAGLILVVGLCFLVETGLIPPAWRAVI